MYVELKINVAPEVVGQMEKICDLKGWEAEEGLRKIIDAGLCYLMAENRLAEFAARGVERDERILMVTQEWMELSREYAALRFRIYELTEANKVLNFHIAGLEAENEALKAVNQRLKADLTGER